MNKDLLPVVWKMETLGIAIDRKQIRDSLDSCEHWMRYCHKRCQEITGMDVPSSASANTCFEW